MDEEDELLKRCKQVAETNGATFEQVREGSRHTVFACNQQRVAVPRHREINERTARAILATVELAAGGA